MDSQDQLHDRARSPSVGVQNRSLSRSVSPHPQYQDLSTTTAASFPAVSYQTSLPGSTAAEAYRFTNAYLTPAQASHTSPPPPEQAYAQNQQYSQSFETTFVNQLEQSSAQREENFSNLLNSNPTDFDFNLYPTDNSGVPSEFDSSLLLDPQQQAQQSSQPGNQSVNPADLVSAMSSPHNAASPHLLSPEQHSSPGHNHTSPPPASTSAPFYSPQHSRHTSLDPMSAAYMTSQSQSDWQGLLGNPSFQGHRRAPSEHSDVSSAAHSPFMAHQESFEGVESNHSPLFAAQNDPSLYDNALGIESFSLSEQQQQQQGFSPAHSPYMSPQQTGDVGNEPLFLSTQQTSNQFPALPADMYISGEGAMTSAQQGGTSSGEMGQAAQMAPPPSINVELAPPSRMPSFGPGKEADFDALAPPSRSRGRSKSDPFGRPVARPRSPSTTSSLEPVAATSPRSLSPFDSVGGSRSTPGSRDPSPSSKSARRQSTSSIDSRNYILDLADPQRPGATSSDSKRMQKHPATFQCHLCPKRFTRAYNLRSHLRTHTDERPFVCTVCGKAFARQHDRKRHEGLHSGEKKFVCRGDLAGGGQWGCGRRFARADALGRHFRSEAGRICIKPLLDEEANERNRTLMEQQQQQRQQQQQTGHLQPVTQPMMISGMDGQQPGGGFTLPAALLAQYPALQTLQWDQLAPTGEDPNDISGRSSFDASSGGEFGYDDDDSGLSYSGGPGAMYGINNQGGQMLGVNTGDAGYGSQEWTGEFDRR
ncbi:hypothetical protein VTN77DRAFT_1248 [Rasamsonia byssochlamydoides]|uniref:uncharacterized protein n=1 Tax=Rasamsonia byssochlamydoides TaxID=89139 RepID=UPI00374386EF